MSSPLQNFVHMKHTDQRMKYTTLRLAARSYNLYSEEDIVPLPSIVHEKACQSFLSGFPAFTGIARYQ